MPVVEDVRELGTYLSWRVYPFPVAAALCRLNERSFAECRTGVPCEPYRFPLFPIVARAPLRLRAKKKGSGSRGPRAYVAVWTGTVLVAYAQKNKRR